MARNENPRVYAGRSANQRQEERKLQFIASAKELIGTQGFRALTVRKLCEQTNLSQRYYYESFTSLEEVLADVYKAQIQIVESHIMRHIQDESDGAAMAKSGLGGFLDLLKQDQALARIIMFEVLGVSANIDQLYLDTMRYFMNLIIETAKQSYPEINGLRFNEEIVGTALIGAILNVSKDWILSNYEWDRQEIISNLFSVVGHIVKTQRSDGNNAITF